MDLLKNILKIIGLLFLLAVVIGQTDLGNLSPQDEKEAHSYLAFGENKVRFSQKGQGKDILLIHGSTGSLEDWSYIIDALSTRYRITSFDRICHGYSSCENYQFNLNDNAELVKKIIDKLGLKKPMIIGHSYGGLVVAHLLANGYNDRLKYMIIDSPLFELAANFRFKLLSTPLLGNALAVITKFTISEIGIENGLQDLSVNKEEKEKIISKRKKLWSQPKAQTAMSKEIINCQRNLHEISPKYKNISTQVTIVTGSDFDKTFRHQAEKFSEHITNDSLIIIPYAGHYMLLDRSKVIIGLIQSQLN